MPIPTDDPTGALIESCLNRLRRLEEERARQAMQMASVLLLAGKGSVSGEVDASVS